MKQRNTSMISLLVVERRSVNADISILILAGKVCQRKVQRTLHCRIYL